MYTLDSIGQKWTGGGDPSASSGKIPRVRISEVKKHNFVSRYFTQRNLTRPEKRKENPVENVQTINDRSTPKRNRDFERIQMGENSSPSKKFKFNNTMKIWKGREDACIALKKFCEKSETHT